MTEGLLNAEAIIGAYLRSLPKVESLEATVGGKTPDSTAKPWVRITLVDPENRTGTRQVEHLVGYYLQLDCYAGAEGGRTEAWALAQAVRQALVEAPNSELDGAVVSDVEPLTMPRSPDPEIQPTRERYILDVIVTMRPKP
jgi:hypothetical protein